MSVDDIMIYDRYFQIYKDRSYTDIWRTELGFMSVTRTQRTFWYEVVKHWEGITPRNKELPRTKRLDGRSLVRAIILTIVTTIVVAANNDRFLLYTRHCVILYKEGTTTIVVL